MMSLPLVAQEERAVERPPLVQGRELIAQGHFADAERVLRDFVISNTEHEDAAAASVLQGRALMRLNRTDDARRSFEWVLSRHPHSAQAASALEGIIQFHEHRKNGTGAQDVRRRLLREHPDSEVTARVWLPLASEAFEKSDFAQAVAIYTALESGLNDAALKRLEAGRILVDCDADPVRLVDVATETLFDNNPVTARLLLEHFIGKHPRHGRIHEARTRLGWALYQRGDEDSHGRAERLWSEVARAEPKGEWGGKSRWHLAQLYAGPKGDWKASLALLESIVDDFAVGTHRHEQALYTRAWLFWVQRQWPEAVAGFQDLIDAYPEKAQHPAIVRYMEEAGARMDR